MKKSANHYGKGIAGSLFMDLQIAGAMSREELTALAEAPCYVPHLPYAEIVKWRFNLLQQIGEDLVLTVQHKEQFKLINARIAELELINRSNHEAAKLISDYLKG